MADMANQAYGEYDKGGVSALGDYAAETGGGMVDQLKGFGQNVYDIYQDPNGGGFFPALGYAADRAIVEPLEQSTKAVRNVGAMGANWALDDQEAFSVYDMQKRGFGNVLGEQADPNDYRDFDPGQHYRNVDRAKGAPGTEGIAKVPPTGGTVSKAAAEMPPKFDAYDMNNYVAPDPGSRLTMEGRTPIYSRDMVGQDREEFGKTMYGDTPASVNPDIMGVPGTYTKTDDFANRQGQIAQNAQADYEAQLKQQADQAALIALSEGKAPGGEVPKGMPTPMDVAGTDRAQKIAMIRNMQSRADMIDQGNVLARQMMEQEGQDRGVMGMGGYDAMRYDQVDANELLRGNAQLSRGNTRINTSKGIGFPVADDLQTVVGQAYSHR